MRTWYTARGRSMPDANLKQALLPEGAEFIDNPIGTASTGQGRFAIAVSTAEGSATRYAALPGSRAWTRRGGAEPAAGKDKPYG